MRKERGTGLMDERSWGPGVSELQMLCPLHNLMRLQGSISTNLSGEDRILS